MIWIILYWIPLVILNIIFLYLFFTGFVKEVHDRISQKVRDKDELKGHILFINTLMFCLVIGTIVPIVNLIILLKLMT